MPQHLCKACATKTYNSVLTNIGNVKRCITYYLSLHIPHYNNTKAVQHVFLT